MDKNCEDVPSIGIEKVNEIKESATNEKAMGSGEILTADLAHNSETL